MKFMSTDPRNFEPADWKEYSSKVSIAKPLQSLNLPVISMITTTRNISSKIELDATEYQCIIHQEYIIAAFGSFAPFWTNNTLEKYKLMNQSSSSSPLLPNPSINSFCTIFTEGLKLT